MQNRTAFVFLFAFAAAGCATHTDNQLPEPNVVALYSVPPHASVNLDCGAGTIAHGTTPMRVDVPRYPERCTIEVTSGGYRPLNMRFDRGLVLKEGVPLHMDASHSLDQKAGTIDMILFPLRNLADRVENAASRACSADYRLELKLTPLGQ
ncbi:MAG: hypothetical protein QOC81_1987 [Thermoanaerobaculia bacterium]|jgi:hypothetical protein|nr:hypothetical protein [Thermoanaerobaculia bacterium]